MKNVLPTYFSSEWSFASFKYKEHIGGKVINCFTKEGNLVLLSADGNYIHLGVDYKEGECTLEKEFSLID
jgi:hypothetical protein